MQVMFIRKAVVRTSDDTKRERFLLSTCMNLVLTSSLDTCEGWERRRASFLILHLIMFMAAGCWMLSSGDEIQTCSTRHTPVARIHKSVGVGCKYPGVCEPQAMSILSRTSSVIRVHFTNTCIIYTDISA